MARESVCKVVCALDSRVSFSGQIQGIHGGVCPKFDLWVKNPWRHVE